MNPQARSAALGAATGSRTTYGLTAVSLISAPTSRGLLGRLTSDRGRKVMAGLAGTETVLDVLPMTPSRLRPSALLARLACGAAAAALAAQRDGGRPVEAAKTGAAAAAGAAFAGAAWRRFGVRGGRRDLPKAALEDLVAGTLAAWGARFTAARSL